MLGILPHNIKLQIKAPASDQVRAHEYTLYESGPLNQLSTLQIVRCHKTRSLVEKGKPITPPRW